MGTVRWEIRKFDGSKHRGLSFRLLGRDHFGAWFGIPRGTVVDSGRMWADPSIVLIPHFGWWTAMFNAAPRNTSIYCDVTMPASWQAGHVTTTDLDLDVRKIRETGEVQLVDEDEFAMHRVKFNYPDELVAQARETAQWLVRSIREGVEPFGAYSQRWLAHLTI